MGNESSSMSETDTYEYSSEVNSLKEDKTSSSEEFKEDNLLVNKPQNKFARFIVKELDENKEIQKQHYYKAWNLLKSLELSDVIASKKQTKDIINLWLKFFRKNKFRIHLNSEDVLFPINKTLLLSGIKITLISTFKYLQNRRNKKLKNSTIEKLSMVIKQLYKEFDNKAKNKIKKSIKKSIKKEIKVIQSLQKQKTNVINNKKILKASDFIEQDQFFNVKKQEKKFKNAADLLKSQTEVNSEQSEIQIDKENILQYEPSQKLDESIFNNNEEINLLNLLNNSNINIEQQNKKEIPINYQSEEEYFEDEGFETVQNQYDKSHKNVNITEKSLIEEYQNFSKNYQIYQQSIDQSQKSIKKYHTMNKVEKFIKQHDINNSVFTCPNQIISKPNYERLNHSFLSQKFLQDDDIDEDGKSLYNQNKNYEVKPQKSFFKIKPKAQRQIIDIPCMNPIPFGFKVQRKRIFIPQINPKPVNYFKPKFHQNIQKIINLLKPQPRGFKIFNKTKEIINSFKLTAPNKKLKSQDFFNFSLKKLKSSIFRKKEYSKFGKTHITIQNVFQINSILQESYDEMIQQKRKDFWKINQSIFTYFSSIVKWILIIIGFLCISQNNVTNNFKVYNDLDRLEDLLDDLKYYSEDNQKIKQKNYQEIFSTKKK